MIQVTIGCDKKGCTESLEYSVKSINSILSVLKKSGFDFVVRPDSKQDILLCKKCQKELGIVVGELEESRKAVFSEFFEGSKDK